MQGRQIRLNGEGLKTKPVFCCLLPWKVERFCTLHKQARLQIQRKKQFLFFCNLRHGKHTLTPFSDNKTSTKTTVCVPKSYYRLKKYVTTLSFATAQTHSKHGQNACRFCVLRHCTRKTFVTISSALQFASAYQTTNKTIWFLLSKCVTPQTNKFLCVRTTENAFVLFANLLFKMYKTVNRQYKRNILHFYTTVKQIAVSCLRSKVKLANTSTGTTHTLQKIQLLPFEGHKTATATWQNKKNLTSNEVRFFVFVSIT